MTSIRLALLGALCCGLLGAAAPPSTFRLADAAAARCAIVYPSGDAFCERTAKQLAAWIEEQGGRRPAISGDRDFRDPGPKQALILLDGTAEQRLATRWRVKAPVKGDREEAYRLSAGWRAGRFVVLAAGRGSPGARRAAYRLMREMDVRGGAVLLRPLDVASEPFLATRSIALFNIWRMPVSVMRRYNLEAWPVEKIGRYLDMLDVFGFNAIETHDRFNDRYIQPCFGVTRDEWSQKMLRMADHAHQNGQKVFLRAWGNAVMNVPEDFHPTGPTSLVPRGSRLYCTNDARERVLWERDILDYYSRRYAGRIDHLIGHWSDVSGCQRNGCNIRTAMNLHMEIHRAFKKLDPKFESTFSLWFLHRYKPPGQGYNSTNGWAGYEDHRSVIRAGILDRDVLIGMAPGPGEPRPYPVDVEREIYEAGHRAGFWTWYRGDYETRPSLHSHIRGLVGNYYGNLPDSARNLDWHNVERNVHGAANVASYYVAAGLMWDRSAGAERLLNEFLTLVFGAENAARIAPAYYAIEQIRCTRCTEDAAPAGWGSDDAGLDYDRAVQALKGLNAVRIDPAYRSRLPLVISRDDIFAELRESLEVIRDYAMCRARELPAAQAEISKGRREEAARRLDRLEKNYASWEGTLSGHQEWKLLKQRIETLRKSMQ